MARLISPKFGGRHEKDMHILGLGSSVGTPVGGIEADVLVVKSFDELREKSAQVWSESSVYFFKNRSSLQ